MSVIERTIYQCDSCGEEHESDDGMIWIVEIGKAVNGHNEITGDDVLFCDKECLKKWIDEVFS